MLGPGPPFVTGFLKFLKVFLFLYVQLYKLRFCAFLRANDFPQNLDGCKFCIIKERNFKFSGNVQLLVRYSGHRKERLAVH